MDLTPRTEDFGQEDQTWLGSAHGTNSARTVTVDLSTFTEGTHFPDGVLPSGTPLGEITADGTVGLYDNAAADGRQTLAGFLFTSVAARNATGTVHGALLDHGRVIEANLPFTVDAAGQTDVAGRIIFV